MSFFNRRQQDNEEDTPDDSANKQESAVEVSGETSPDYSPPEVTRDVSSRMFDTALGAGSELEGKLHSDGNVRLDGRFIGSLDITENVLIGETATIEADVTAQNITIAGTVKGNVTGKKIHLLATARIEGDITAEALITEDGATIEGRVSMGNAANTTPNLQPPSEIHDTLD